MLPPFLRKLPPLELAVLIELGAAQKLARLALRPQERDAGLAGGQRLEVRCPRRLRPEVDLVDQAQDQFHVGRHVGQQPRTARHSSAPARPGSPHGLPPLPPRGLAAVAAAPVLAASSALERDDVRQVMHPLFGILTHVRPTAMSRLANTPPALIVPEARRSSSLSSHQKPVCRSHVLNAPNAVSASGVPGRSLRVLFARPREEALASRLRLLPGPMPQRLVQRSWLSVATAGRN